MNANRGQGADGSDLFGNPLPVYPDHAAKSVGQAPLRRPLSVRRTMTIEATWPCGPESPARYEGRCRDIWTGEGVGSPVILAEDGLSAEAVRRRLCSVKAAPPRPALEALGGKNAGRESRNAVDELLPDEAANATPLHLMLDDLSGATIVSGFALFAWDPDSNKHRVGKSERSVRESMTGVCMAFREGSSALAEMCRAECHQHRINAVALAHPEDPEGWHPLGEPRQPHFRRARRIDAWKEDGNLHIDAMFQDSAATKNGIRRAIHEYALHAIVDLSAGRLTALNAVAGTLPYRECQAAPVNLPALLGTPVGELRQRVLDLFRRSNGCTHLNDAIRSLAEMPALFGKMAE